MCVYIYIYIYIYIYMGVNACLHIYLYTDAFNIFFIEMVILASEMFLYEGRNEMFYLTKHSTHFIYGYMALDIW